MSILKQHIMVGMSGGVDSSVAAFLLKEAGHPISGVFMKNWEESTEDGHCPASIERQEAQAVCDALGIELHSVNFAKEYWERVFSYFLDEYRAGRTPNPDILCNKEIKFKAFLDYAKLRGAHSIATGHYTRVRTIGNVTQLLKGIDANKDQSYFLHALNQEQLAHSIFPVGDRTKEEVRILAKKIGLKNHAKKDSTGICFIGERKFKTFLNDYLPAKPGPIVDVNGQEVGKHDGLMFYTIGQRQGLGIGGLKNKPEVPWYVVRKNMPENKLVVAQGEHPSLYAHALVAKDLHWIDAPPEEDVLISAKIRYRQSDQACKIYLTDHTQVRVAFVEPQRAITPGQSIVFYQEDICLGGGIIVEALSH